MIVKYPNKILREKSLPVKPEEILNPEIKGLISDMKTWIKKAGGVGLAAVQIGILKRVILVEFDDGLRAFINPEIIRKSWKKTAIEEGCLSVPGKNGYVKRSETIILKSLDENGKEHKLRFSGLAAIVIQHEVDHLNGVLFIDKIWKK